MVCTLSMSQSSPSHIKVSAVVDTREDVTIISTTDTWPQTWPTTATGSVVAGLGGTTQSHLSCKPVLVKNPEGQTATKCSYITAAPPNLWGRDVLSAWGDWVGTDL